MSTPNASAEPWPADAAPEKWVATLFEKMLRMWGNRFLDQWREVGLEGVKIEWGKGLRKLSTAELKAGVDALLTLKFPPSLPEFYGLCKQMRLVELAKPGALADQTKADPNLVAANVKRMRELLAPLMQPKDPTCRWAYLMLMRGESASGKPYPHEVIRCASDAITSSAGRKAIDECTDEFERENFRTIRESIIEGRRSAGQPLWEVV